MIIAIDARIVAEKMDGAGRVMLSLIKNLDMYPQHNFLVFYNSNEALQNNANNITYIKVGIKIASMRNLFFAWQKINKYKFDVYFYGYFDLPFFIKGKRSSIVYDLFFMKDPLYFDTKKRLFFPMFRILTWARLLSPNHIFSISKVVEQQITALPLLSNKTVHTKHLGTSPAYLDTLLDTRDNNVNLDYLLYVGNNRKHKNVPFLIEAFSKLKTNAHLILVGNIDNRFDDLQHLIERSPSKDRITHLSMVSDDKLEKLYKYSLGVIIPSKYEGFGLPLIEASQKKIPILCSDIEIFREIMGTNAYYFSTTDIDNVCSVIQRFLDSPDERNKRALSAFEHTKHLTEKNYCDFIIEKLEDLGND